MTDYTWPSIYFAYLFFAICFLAAVFFFLRSWKDGYWSKQGEDIKYQVFDDLENREGAPQSQAEEQMHVPR